jgi:glucose/mannose-6-phosphate isomerase
VKVVLPDVIDTLDMFGAIAGLPEQVEQAAAAAKQVTGPLPHHDDIENVVVLGMGGSGIAGDVVREVAGPFMPVPVVVHKGYGMPNFISDNSLVFAVSFSGNTEETLEAVGEAAAAGGHIVAVSQGGELRAMAEEWGAPHLALADGIPMPRAGIGAVSIPPLLVLEQVGLFPGASSWIDAAVAQLQKRRDELVTDSNPARDLARRIGRELPIVYGGGGLGSAAALRLKNQFNENAKVPSFWNQLPELCHNELCGWGQHGDVTRQVFRLVNLRHDFEHPQIIRRFELVNEMVDEVVSEIEEIRAEGEGALAQLFDLVIYGDFVSLYLAYAADVDPGPVAVLDWMKERLVEPV